MSGQAGGLRLEEVEKEKSMVNIYCMKRLIKLKEIWNKNILLATKLWPNRDIIQMIAMFFCLWLIVFIFLYVCVVLLFSLEMQAIQNLKVCSAWGEIKPARDTFADGKARIPTTQRMAMNKSKSY